MDAELSKKVERMIKQADSEFEEVRVNFRWGHKQLAVIKRAADLIGVPYQTYIKSVLMRQAREDIRDFSDTDESSNLYKPSSEPSPVLKERTTNYKATASKTNRKQKQK